MLNTFLSPPEFINCNGKLISLLVPKIMGILNITPDSFYDGGYYRTEKEIRKRIETMIEEGADFIDIGAISSRPWADILDETTEWERLEKVLPMIKDYVSEVCFSIDSFRANIVKRAVNEFGVGMINDITAGSMDNNMFQIVAELQVPYIIMHMRGIPKTMQIDPEYNNVTVDIIRFFSKKIAHLKLLGVNDVIIDPGFGFGKTIEDNYQLLRNLDSFKVLELPLLVGLSRKSMIYKLLDTTPDDALAGTIVLNTLALLNGAAILRVHDVKEAVQMIRIIEKIKK